MGPGTATPAPDSLSGLNQAALEECGPQRSQVANYVNGPRSLHVEAIQFGDRTGAFSAFTLAEQPGMREGHDLGVDDAVGARGVVFTVGSTVVEASNATFADLAALKPLSRVMPKITGNQGIAPLLPSLAPSKGLVNGSLKYALGAQTYAAEGGVLPADSLGWNKSAEAVTAQYALGRGKETLTVLFYPTPQIAGNFAKSIQQALPRLGPKFASARIRRESVLVLLADGSLSGIAAQKMIDAIHLPQEVSFDKVNPTANPQISQTYSLLANVMLLSAVLMSAAILLGLFLGGGRALVRVLRGKSAAAEPEFLSLHLAPQNKPPEFSAPDTAKPS